MTALIDRDEDVDNVVECVGNMAELEWKFPIGSLIDNNLPQEVRAGLEKLHAGCRHAGPRRPRHPLGVRQGHGDHRPGGAAAGEKGQYDSRPPTEPAGAQPGLAVEAGRKVTEEL